MIAYKEPACHEENREMSPPPPHRGEVVATYIGQRGDHYWLTREPL